MANQNPTPVLTTLQKCGMAAETTWGTAVTPTTALLSVRMVPQPRISLQTFIARGYRIPTAASLSEKMAEIRFEGVATYEEIGNFVADIGSAGTTTVNSYTVAVGSKQYAGAAVNAWTLRGDRDRVELSGSMLSKWASSFAGSLTDPTSLPTVIDQSQVQLTLGSATLSRWFSWTVDVSDIIDLVRFAGAAQPGAVVCPESLRIRFSVEFEANSTNLAFIDDANIENVVDWQVSATKDTHSLSIAGQGRIAEIRAFDDTDGIYSYGVTVETLADGAGALDVTIA